MKKLLFIAAVILFASCTKESVNEQVGAKPTQTNLTKENDKSERPDIYDIWGK